MGYKTIITTFFFFLSIFLSIFVQSVSASWWNDSWKYRKQLTFQNSAQNENLTNFPVLVKLTSSNFDFSKAQSTGYDIRFLDSNDNTELPYEIEKWDASAQEAYVWVKVPQIDASSNSDYIFLYYGNASAMNAQSTINVWDNNFVLVNHLHGTQNPQPDSTIYGNNGTPNLTKIGTANGIAGGADTWNGTSDYLIFPNQGTHSPENNSYTWELWFKTNLDAANRHEEGTYIVDTNTSGTADSYRIYQSQSSNLILFFVTDNGVNSSLATPITYNDDHWHYLVGIIDKTQNKQKLYVDSNLVAEKNYTLGSIDVDRNLFIGRHVTHTLEYQGDLDELRLSKGSARSANWITATYKTINNVFITYSSEDTYIHSTIDTQYVSQSSTIKPSCTNSAPAAPDLFQINTTKNSATLYFTPAGNPHNSYTISYGYDDNVERFGTGFSKMSGDGVQSYTINALSPNTKYFFKIKANNGCMPGPWSRSMIVNTAYSNLGFIYYAYSSVVKMINSALH